MLAWRIKTHTSGRRPLLLIRTRIRKTIILLFVFFATITGALAQDYDYAKLLGGVSGEARGEGIVVNNAGDVYIKGVFSGALRMGNNVYQASPEDAFSVRMDQGGNFHWFKKLGFTDVEDAYVEGDGDIAIDASNNVYVVGAFQGAANLDGTALTSQGGTDVYVLKYDPDGYLVWARNLGAWAWMPPPPLRSMLQDMFIYPGVPEATLSISTVQG
jgi:hypothetical protein